MPGFFRRLALAFASFFRLILGRPLPPLAIEHFGGSSRPAAAPKPLPAPLPPPRPPAATKPALDDASARGAVALLALLQREGRLVDFLMEDIEDYGDDRVGAAARAVHKGCRRALRERLALAPVIESGEGERVRVDDDFDPARIRLVGDVRGKPPFDGKLAHPGWRAAKVDVAPAAGDVVAPAEVEL